MKQTLPFPQTPSTPLYFHILYLLLIFITACSVFKERAFLQSDSLQKQNTRRETTTQESMQVDAVRVYNRQDSSDKQSFTEIFPDGLFSYSSQQGFSGNATRVVIKERTKAGVRTSDSVELKQSKSAVSKLHENERLLTQTRLKEKVVSVSNFNLWYLAGLLLIFVTVYLVRCRLQE